METLTQPRQRTEEPPKEANEEADTSQRRGRSSRRSLTSICEISEVIFTTFFSVFLEVWGKKEIGQKGSRWLPLVPQQERGRGSPPSHPPPPNC